MPDMITMNAGAMAAKFESRMRTVGTNLRRLVSKATRDQMASTRQVIVATTPVDSGDLRDAWSPVVQGNDDLSWKITNATHYGPTLEYGGYRSVGPRTIQLGGGDLGAGFVAAGGIYSKQAPLGWVRRGLAGSLDPWTLRLRNALSEAWGGLGTPVDAVPTPSVNVVYGPSGASVDLTRQLIGLGMKMKRARQRKSKS